MADCNNGIYVYPYNRFIQHDPKSILFQTNEISLLLNLHLERDQPYRVGNRSLSWIEVLVRPIMQLAISIAYRWIPDLLYSRNGAYPLQSLLMALKITLLPSARTQYKSLFMKAWQHSTSILQCPRVKLWKQFSTKQQVYGTLWYWLDPETSVAQRIRCCWNSNSWGRRQLCFSRRYDPHISPL